MFIRHVWSRHELESEFLRQLRHLNLEIRGHLSNRGIRGRALIRRMRHFEHDSCQLQYPATGTLRRNKALLVQRRCVRRRPWRVVGPARSLHDASVNPADRRLPDEAKSDIELRSQTLEDRDDA